MTEHLHELPPKAEGTDILTALARAIESADMPGPYSRQAEAALKHLAASGFCIVPIKDGW